MSKFLQIGTTSTMVQKIPKSLISKFTLKILESLIIKISTPCPLLIFSLGLLYIAVLVTLVTGFNHRDSNILGVENIQRMGCEYSNKCWWCCAQISSGSSKATRRLNLHAKAKSLYSSLSSGPHPPQIHDESPEPQLGRVSILVKSLILFGKGYLGPWG